MNPNRDLSLDLARFEFLWPKAYPYFSKIPLITKFATKLLADDILQLGQLHEKAISVQCRMLRESADGRDFENGDDAKLVAVRTSHYGASYSAPVTNIHVNRGKLLVSVYERKQNNWFFFKIPFSAYKHIPKTSNIEIPFDMDGTPRRENRSAVNWWKFEVKSMKEFGTK